MSQTVQARQYERWDELCYRVYGRAEESDVMVLRATNREVVRQGAAFVFAGGEPIRVPFLTLTSSVQDQGVAPWQR